MSYPAEFSDTSRNFGAKTSRWYMRLSDYASLHPDTKTQKTEFYKYNTGVEVEQKDAEAKFIVNRLRNEMVGAVTVHQVVEATKRDTCFIELSVAADDLMRGQKLVGDVFETVPEGHTGGTSILRLQGFNCGER